MKTAIPLLAALFFIFPPSVSALTLDSLGGDCRESGIWDASSLTCTLTEDFSGSVSIIADSITLDGAGHTITGTGSGISASGRNFLTVKNLTLAGFGAGMKFSLVGHSTISGNTIRTGENGIGLSLSANTSSNTIQDNIIEGSGNIGIFVSDANFNVFRRNTIRNFKSGLLFTYCSGQNTFRENTIEGNDIGASFAGSWGTFTRNNFKNNGGDFQNGLATCGNGIETLSKPLPEGGNHWSKNTACRDENGDHLCDAPYAAATSTDNSTNLPVTFFDNFPWTAENGWNAPTTSPPALSNPTETEDDGNQDAKGTADKTNFTFAISYAGAATPSDVTLWTNDGAIVSQYPLLTQGSPVYSMTSTFPKGRYGYHFEANGGAQRFPASGELAFTAGYSNVAFLPGLEASRLYDAGGNKLWEPYGDADAAVLSLDADGKSVRNDIYTKDVIDNAYVPIIGNVYKSFLEQLDEMKNTEHVIADYSVMPYDWRLSLDDILTSGKKDGENISYLQSTSSPYIIQELRRLAESSDTGKVTVVAHSNGGLVAKALTNKLGLAGSKLLDQMIFVASPQAGTPKAIGAILHGFEQELPTTLLAFGITPQAARELAKNMPSAYNLLPSAQYFTYTDDYVVTFATSSAFLAPWVEKYGDIIHSSERLHNFLADQTRASSSPDLYYPIAGNPNLLNRAELLHATLDNWTPPEGVTLTEIAGWGEETISTIEYQEGVKGEYDEHGELKFSPSIQYDVKEVLDGDGTVVVPSALWTPGAGKYWVDLNDYNNTRPQSLLHPDREHSSILEVPKLLDFIQNLITRNGNPLPQYISATQPPNPESEKRLNFTLHSPLALDLYDDLGNHTGISTTTNTVEENIPGSRYNTFGELKYIRVLAGVPLHLSLRGYAAGSFTLDMKEFLGDTVTASATFAGIPSFVGTTAAIDIPNGNIASSSPLSVDENGDGIADFSLAPKLGEIITPPKYRFDGFLQPINDIAYHPTQTPSVFKGGSTIPVKFQIKKSDGTPIQASTMPLFLIPQNGGAMTASVDESAYSDTASTGNAFRWDNTSQQYIYNWSTKGFASGYWYKLSAKLDDGKIYSVTVGLR